jgi:hypothetical protein
VSFTRSGPPGGWSIGSVVSSAALNQIDANIASALDKSLAGDTLSGEILMESTAVIGAQFAGNISAAAAASIISSATGGIASTVPNGIELAGGGTDEILYGSTRTKLVRQGMMPYQGLVSTGWSVSGTGGMGGTASSYIQTIGPLLVHHGADLTNVRVYITVVTHTGLPAALPSLVVKRSDGATVGGATATAAGAAAWNATTYWDCPCATLIDRTQYEYFLELTDEQGSGSVSGNVYTGIVATYGSITTMAFP